MFRYEIKTSLPVIWLDNIDTKKIRVGSDATNTNNDQLILVDPVDDEDEEIFHKLILQLWQCAI